jgi:hypothetical protein
MLLMGLVLGGAILVPLCMAILDRLPVDSGYTSEGKGTACRTGEGQAG